jgi:hypothetical protein
MPANATYSRIVPGMERVWIRRFRWERKTGWGPSGFFSPILLVVLGVFD